MMQLLMKIGRNDPCPCGSGRKYKKCCAGSKEPLKVNMKDYYLRNYDIHLKTPEQIEGIRRAGRLVMETHGLVAESLKPGMTTDEINDIVHRHTLKNGGIPAPLNYRGFPKSVCVSPNEIICHGIPGERVLVDGDIVNVDITTILDGYYADANYTYFVGTPSPGARRLVEVTLESLRRGLDMVRPGNTTGDIGWAIQRYAEGEGYSVVREFVGHGVGLDFHESPQILHFGKKGTGVPLVPGMTFTVEPMVNLGKKELYILEDRWTAVTRDGGLSAQFEQTIVVTEDGYESLTPFPLDACIQNL
ncbi:type I methionyl aminopeptidase [Desulfobotulus sp. H1]|uniref:Methionine aminopeptidase n=1 Tax=Desulfobotulus pelophilus TaxID=2823377 RepID=A0ABT3N6J6_9BACT|nr:type I methionyl aminopeptidase [Desulfobotulus pelophilus]MCW7753083.1 type I methionyl aminopeptidase [Desulfobotulus pelophilus]